MKVILQHTTTSLHHVLRGKHRRGRHVRRRRRRHRRHGRRVRHWRLLLHLRRRPAVHPQRRHGLSGLLIGLDRFSLVTLTSRVNHTFDDTGLSHVVTHGGGGRVAARLGCSLHHCPTSIPQLSHKPTTLPQ